MSKPIYCDKCKKEIRVREDLVTATMVIEVVPYHEACYAKDLKGAKTFFLDNQPINGFSGNVGIFFVMILAFFWLLFADGASKAASLLALIPIGYRLYSYLTYERHVEK
ncbi:hypothetical protein GLW08_04750 [Pontibacillus yanchengensis]|uniref:Uncharacterized protein n=2 Tax=Pontibacillus yanchengensis TaxID=462910 RepID=A0ACC7VFF0_9BACI|nr:hypothetical protein [Pontibacillus yanchengensis]MYL32065.1 hypothetical protein [Pontibacillus yanchengensis]MYL52644.1 hypothetical protein [Pontibacillus yanchengensis]